jgi:hypothetical protein
MPKESLSNLVMDMCSKIGKEIRQEAFDGVALRRLKDIQYLVRRVRPGWPLCPST